MELDIRRQPRFLRWESGAHLGVCLLAVIGTAWTLGLLATAWGAKWEDLQEKVRADAAAEGVSEVVRHDLLGLLEVGEGFMSILKGGCTAMLLLAALGAIREARFLVVTRTWVSEGIGGDLGPGLRQ